MIKFLVLFSAMVLADSAQNEQSIGSWGPNVRPTGKQSPNEQHAENASPDEEILNGWMVKVKYDKYFEYHYGFFIKPRVFLTSSWNVDSLDIQSIDVSNDLHNSWPNKRSLHVDFQNLYFGMELTKRPNNSQRDLAVLITDQPVIPAFKINENTFIKVVSDINDVDLTKCFIQASNTSTMSFYDCHLENAGSLSNADRFFECSVNGGQKDLSKESGFFCKFKEFPHNTGFVGLATIGYHTHKKSNKTLKLISNLCGLNLTEIKKLAEVK